MGGWCCYLLMENSQIILLGRLDFCVDLCPGARNLWFTKEKGRLLVPLFFFVVYPYTIIGIVVDVEVATTTAFIVCLDTTTEIIYVIIKSYLRERTAIWTLNHILSPSATTRHRPNHNGLKSHHSQGVHCLL